MILSLCTILAHLWHATLIRQHHRSHPKLPVFAIKRSSNAERGKCMTSQLKTREIRQYNGTCNVLHAGNRVAVIPPTPADMSRRCFVIFLWSRNSDVLVNSLYRQAGTSELNLKLGSKGAVLHYSLSADAIHSLVITDIKTQTPICIVSHFSTSHTSLLVYRLNLLQQTRQRTRLCTLA